MCFFCLFIAHSLFFSSTLKASQILPTCPLSQVSNLQGFVLCERFCICPACVQRGSGLGQAGVSTNARTRAKPAKHSELSYEMRPACAKPPVGRSGFIFAYFFNISLISIFSTSYFFSKQNLRLQKYANISMFRKYFLHLWLI